MQEATLNLLFEDPELKEEEEDDHNKSSSSGSENENTSNLEEICMKLRNENNDLKDKNSSLEVLVNDLGNEYTSIKQQFLDFKNQSTEELGKVLESEKNELEKNLELAKRERDETLARENELSDLLEKAFDNNRLFNEMMVKKEEEIEKLNRDKEDLENDLKFSQEKLSVALSTANPSNSSNFSEKEIETMKTSLISEFNAQKAEFLKKIAILEMESAKLLKTKQILEEKMQGYMVEANRAKKEQESCEILTTRVVLEQKEAKTKILTLEAQKKELEDKMLKFSHFQQKFEESEAKKTDIEQEIQEIEIILKGKEEELLNLQISLEKQGKLISCLSQDKELLENENISLKDQNSEKNSAIESLQSEKIEIEKNLDVFLTKNKEIQEICQNLEIEIHNLKQKNTQLENQIEENEKYSKSTQNKQILIISEISASLEQKISENETLRQENAQNLQKIQELQQIMQENRTLKSELLETSSNLEKIIQEHEKTISGLTVVKNSIEIEKNNNLTAFEEAKTEIKAKDSKILELEQEIKKSAAKMEKLERQATSFILNEANLQIDIDVKSSEIERLKKQEIAFNLEINAKNTEIGSLKKQEIEFNLEMNAKNTEIENLKKQEIEFKQEIEKLKHDSSKSSDFLQIPSQNKLFSPKIEKNPIKIESKPSNIEESIQRNSKYLVGFVANIPIQISDASFENTDPSPSIELVGDTTPDFNFTSPKNKKKPQKKKKKGKHRNSDDEVEYMGEIEKPKDQSPTTYITSSGDEFEEFKGFEDTQSEKDEELKNFEQKMEASLKASEQNQNIGKGKEKRHSESDQAKKICDELIDNLRKSLSSTEDEEKENKTPKKIEEQEEEDKENKIPILTVENSDKENQISSKDYSNAENSPQIQQKTTENPSNSPNLIDNSEEDAFIASASSSDIGEENRINFNNYVKNPQKTQNDDANGPRILRKSKSSSLGSSISQKMPAASPVTSVLNVMREMDENSNSNSNHVLGTPAVRRKEINRYDNPMMRILNAQEKISSKLDERNEKKRKSEENAPKEDENPTKKRRKTKENDNSSQNQNSLNLGLDLNKKNNNSLNLALDLNKKNDNSALLSLFDDDKNSNSSSSSTTTTTTTTTTAGIPPVRRRRRNIIRSET